LPERPNTLWYAMALAFATALTVYPQSMGSINGAVLDSTQAVIPDAEVVLVNIDTHETRQVRSSREGYFNLVDLGSGRYSLRITAGGFKAFVQEPLVLTVGQNMTVHPVLQVGAVSESVEVSGVAAPVTTSSSSVSHLVDSQRIEQLPLNGRNALQLVSLTPGVVTLAAGGQWGAMQTTFSASGGRSVDMNFSLDGGFNMNPFYDIANSYPNPDTLQEFAVSTRQYSAAFGRGSSSVSAVTKSGTNQFHGSAFEFLRNDKLDSRAFFAPSRPVFKRNQYGATVGGPVIKNKFFFLVGYQGTQARGTPGVTNNRVFSTAERNGDFSSAAAIKDPLTGTVFPGNVIPASRIQGYSTTFINQYVPLPNSPGNLYQFSIPSWLSQNQATARADYSATDKDKIWFRFFLDDAPAKGTVNAIDPSWISDYPARNYNYAVGYSRVFTPNLVNDFRIAYSRNVFGVIGLKKFSLPSIGVKLPDANTVNEYGLTSQTNLAISGYFTENMGAPTRDIMATTHLSDGLSWIRGAHQFNFGVEIYRNRVNELQNWLTGGFPTINGSASGNAAADFLLGYFASFRQISGFASRLHQILPSFFAQDDIKVSRRVTLNLGLRWDPTRAYYSENDLLMSFAPGRQSQLFPKAPSGLLYPGDSGLPRSIIGNRLSNLAPRVGVAWDVRGNGQTSVRAGMGIYYIPLTRGSTYNRFPTIQPYTGDVTVNAGNLSNIWAAAPFNGTSPFPRPDVSNLNALRALDFLPTANETSFSLPFKTQSDRQWSLSIQQAVGKQAVLDVSYVGSSASHLFTSVEANPAPFIPGQSTLANVQQRRLAPQIGAVNSSVSGLSSNYNSLQVSFTKRYGHGFSLVSSYTWSKALGIGTAAENEGSNGPRNPSNYRMDYSALGFDRRHNFVTSGIWDLPFGQNARPLERLLIGGWQLSGIVSASTGSPFTVIPGRDNSYVGIGSDSAQLVGDWRISGDRSKAAEIMQWFNTAAFAQNPVGTFGNVGINSIYGPGRWNADMAVSKSVRIRETRKVEFRTSFYNMFNHANLGNPNNSQSSPTFGRITTTSDPRVIEMSLKLLF